MKQVGIIFMIVLIFAFSGCATSNTSPNITSATVSATPKVFCTVLNEPDPLLIGGWQCRSIASQLSRGARILNDPVEYWLVKKDNQYAFYYYHTSRNTSHIGWQPFIIDGNKIRFSKDGTTPSAGYSKIMTENGKVYFVPPHSEKNEMTRIPEK